MLLANRLEVPAEIQAILWDMDGVLIDSLTFDYDVCNRLLAKHAGEQYHVSRETIRLNFPFDLPEFWRRLLSATGMDSAAAANADLQRRPATGPGPLTAATGPLFDRPAVPRRPMQG